MKQFLLSIMLGSVASKKSELMKRENIAFNWPGEKSKKNEWFLFIIKFLHQSLKVYYLQVCYSKTSSHGVL